MDYVFGYASLVAAADPGAMPGRLCGFRRFWGAAMNNWEGGDSAKHWLDRDSSERPRIRVAYLDLREQDGSTVNGLALPVDEVDAQKVADLILIGRAVDHLAIAIENGLQVLWPGGGEHMPVEFLHGAFVAGDRVGKAVDSLDRVAFGIEADG